MSHLEELLTNVPIPTNGEKVFRLNIQKTARRYISAECIRKVRSNFKIEAARFADERDCLRQSDPNNPYIRTIQMVYHLYNKNHVNIKKIVSSYARYKWRGHNTNNLWRFIRGLNKKAENQSNVNIRSSQIEKPLQLVAAPVNSTFPTPHANDSTKKHTVSAGETGCKHDIHDSPSTNMQKYRYNKMKNLWCHGE